MTTPRDDIAGLIERLRENADMASGGATYVCGPMREAATQLDSLLKERDALQARVKELEGDLVNERRVVTNQSEYRIRAEQERDKAYERAAKVAEDNSYKWVAYLIRRLAGPEKETP